MKSWFSTLSPTVKNIITLVAVGAGLWLTSCGMWDLRGPDEGRYVQIAKELLGRKNWLYLTVHGQPYDQKPPLAFWLFALTLKLTGGEVWSWAVRLPSVLAAIGTLIMTYFMGGRSFGRRAGFFAALMLLTSPVFFEDAPSAELNILYTAAITASICAWLTRPSTSNRLGALRFIAFWGSLAAAFFIKGPLAFVIVLSALAGDAWLNRSWASLKALRPAAGLVILATLIAGWLYLQREIYGAEFVKEQVTGQTLNRLLAGDHSKPFWYYFPRLFTSILFPWALLAIPALMIYIRSRRSVKIDPSAKPYLAWVTFPFLLLCISHGKRQAYLLPLLPAAIILLGGFFEKSLADKTARRPVVGIVVAVIAMAGMGMLGLGLTAIIFPEMVQTDIFRISLPGTILSLLTGLATLVLAVRLGLRKVTNTGLFYGVASAILLLAWTDFMVIRPAFDPSKTTRFLAEVLDLDLKNQAAGRVSTQGQLSVGAIGSASEPEYHVYGHYPVKALTEADLADMSVQDHANPNVVVIETSNKHYAAISERLVDAGYVNRRRYLVSRKSLELYTKALGSEAKQTSAGQTFLFAGDTGSGSPQIHHIVNQMAGRINMSPAQAIFLLGDNLYHGHLPLRALHTLFSEPFAPLLSACVPVFAVLGNHDYMSHRLRAEVEFPLFNMAGNRYYSLEYGVGPGSVSFFIADSETLHQGDPVQLAWLKEFVQRSKSQWKILLMHRPVEASQIDHGPSKLMQELLAPVLANLDIVLSGHNHVYERRNLVDGVLYITSGSGGQLSKATFPPDTGRAVGYNKLGTFVEMKVQPDAVHITAWNEEGEKIDDILLRKHRELFDDLTQD